MTEEEEILRRHSTPGLRRTELTRAAKKAHLASLRLVGEEAEKILDELYPEQAAPTASSAAAKEVLEIIETNTAIARAVLLKWIDKRLGEIERVTGIPREQLWPGFPGKRD
jgi:hypothetical protein